MEDLIVDGHRGKLFIFSLLLCSLVIHAILNSVADLMVHHVHLFRLLQEYGLVIHLVKIDQALVPL